VLKYIGIWYPCGFPKAALGMIAKRKQDMKAGIPLLRIVSVGHEYLNKQEEKTWMH